MGPQPDQDTLEVSNPVKRIRWATHRATGTNAANKRMSLKERLHRRTGSTGEKKRDSMGKETSPAENGDVDSSQADSEDQEAGRTIYFNIPLPPHERDEEGHPLAHYARNKIRTAKYTPITFIPKNLWLQFHNVANMYFLFIIILGVRLHLPESLSLALTCFAIDFPHFWRF